MAWVEERRRKRRERPSKFDVLPTEQPILPLAGVAGELLTQQTRHARRLYVGNLPEQVTEDEIHQSFKSAIAECLVGETLADDPILNVYINHERHFCFIEFKTVEMTTACMQLDGFQLHGHTTKIKRPNDYNELTAPKIHPSQLPNLDVSRLGIISTTVIDGPNKIFIGGLHYHLTEAQVMELLSAFGKIKAFHLVKNDSEDELSKGYCFVEYSDPAITPVAIEGLNGMDIGQGKSLTARLAGERTAGALPPGINPDVVAAPPTLPPPGSAPPPNHTIVSGFDVEALVDAAVGKGPMPMRPIYFDALNQPLTRIVPVTATLMDAPAPPPAPTAAATAPSQSMPTRVLVLSNMVTDDDLSTEEDYQGLKEEVQEECAKYGRLLNIRIPRSGDPGAEHSAIRKIFLEYAEVTDAQAAEQELNGRQFGDSYVSTAFFPEADFVAGRLR